MHTAKTPSDIEALLKAGVATVVFTKSDGTERTLRGTLNEAMIPSNKRTSSGVTHTTETQNVFDMDAGDWRSFRYDSVKAIHTA